MMELQLDVLFSQTLCHPLVQAQTQTVGYSCFSESKPNGANMNSTPNQLHLGGPSVQNGVVRTEKDVRPDNYQSVF